MFKDIADDLIEIAKIAVESIVDEFAIRDSLIHAQKDILIKVHTDNYSMIKVSSIFVPQQVQAAPIIAA